MIKKSICLTFVLLLVSCTGIPQNITPVENFNLQKYLGTWYEVARLDHSFERGLDQVTATYSLRDDGGVKVLNKGYDTQKKTWKEAEGKAYFIGDQKQAHLKVSFFGPFYGSYIVFKLDQENYQYAYITSHKKDFLWLLSRTPEVSAEIKSDFIATVKSQGFNLDEIIYVDQTSKVRPIVN